MRGVIRAAARFPVRFGLGIGPMTRASGAALPMSGSRVMPLLECENDMGGRFTF